MNSAHVSIFIRMSLIFFKVTSLYVRLQSETSHVQHLQGAIEQTRKQFKCTIVKDRDN